MGRRRILVTGAGRYSTRLPLKHGFAITAVHLTLKAKVPGADQTTFGSLPPGQTPAVPFRSCSTPRSPWTKRSRRLCSGGDKHCLSELSAGE
jgi:hypothetical protein